ncbi:MAG TPA: NADH-quinone oxidoreductase subunit J [Acetobacteraceae bacterium]|nr:NADH-quinone oxidoreductase subunit J [Acetobacteraceae bacterium]
MYATICFYIFSIVLVISAAMVVTARNPVHSVLFLIAAFFNAAVLFLIVGAEFLAFILLIVYVGAVAVLFLFVVMMLDIDFEQLRSGFQRYAPVGAAIGALLLAELVLVMLGWPVSSAVSQARFAPAPADISNTDALGRLLYTDYILPFQTAGLVLLVAMIGAIMLTLRDRRRSRHQVVAVQVARRPEDTLELVRVDLGQGVPPDAIRRPLVSEPAGIDEDPLEAQGGAHHPAPAHHAPEAR